MYLNGDDDWTPTLEEQKVPLTPGVMKRSLILILASLVTGFALIWIIRFERFLQIVAVLMKLATLGLGYLIGRKVYNAIGKTYPVWVRVSSAIILGFAVSVATMGLTLSHTLGRIENQMMSDDNGDE